MKRIMMFLLCICAARCCYAGIFLEIWESLGDQTPEITYHYFENNRWRIEDTSGLYTIIDFDKNTFMVVYPNEKIYAIEKLSEVIQEMQRASEKTIAEEANKQERQAIFEKKLIGKETINGIVCNHYKILESGNMIEDIWLSAKLSLLPLEKIFKRLKNVSQPSPAMQEKFIDDENIDKLIAGLGFPIKVKSYTQDGIILSEVKYIIEKSLKEDIFDTPVTYDKIPLIDVYIRAYSEK